MKNKFKRKTHRTGKHSTFKSKLSLIIITLVIFLASSIYLALVNGTGPLTSLLQPASINKVIIEDPNSAKTSKERKAIEKLNNAASAEARNDTEANRRKTEKAYSEVESARSEATSVNTPPLSTNTDKDEIACELKGWTWDGKCTNPALAVVTPPTKSGGQSCAGGFAGVTIPSGTWAASGKNMGEGKESQRECVKCDNGKWVDSAACHDKYAEDPSSVILPPAAGNEYTTGTKTKPGAGTSTSDPDFQENCYTGGLINPTGTQRGTDRCLDGSWVPEAKFDEEKAKTCDPEKAKYNKDTNRCEPIPVAPTIVDVGTPPVVVTPVVPAPASKTNPQSCSSLSCSFGTQKHVLAADQCYCGAVITCTPGVKDKIKTECTKDANGIISTKITTCPVAFTSAGNCARKVGVHVDSPAECKYPHLAVIDPQYGNWICPSDAEGRANTPPKVEASSGGRTLTPQELARTKTYDTYADCSTKTGSLCKVDPNDPKKYVYISYEQAVANASQSQTELNTSDVNNNVTYPNGKVGVHANSPAECKYGNLAVEDPKYGDWLCPSEKEAVANTPPQITQQPETEGTIPSGSKCASFNNNDSCVSDDCRVMNTAAGWGSWCYEPGLKSEDYQDNPATPTQPASLNISSDPNSTTQSIEALSQVPPPPPPVSEKSAYALAIGAGSAVTCIGGALTVGWVAFPANLVAAGVCSVAGIVAGGITYNYSE